MVKSLFQLAFGFAYKKHRKDLRNQQEITGKLSNIIIEIWALESVLLRSEKILSTKCLEEADISMKMSKVLFHDAVERISFLTRSILEGIENEEICRKYLPLIRRVSYSPPINTVALRRNISERMIQWGGYAV